MTEYNQTQLSAETESIACKSQNNYGHYVNGSVKISHHTRFFILATYNLLKKGKRIVSTK